INVRGLDDVDFTPASQPANWDYPDIDLPDGRVMRVLWMNKDEPAAYLDFISTLPAVVEKTVEAAVNSKIPPQLRRNAASGKEERIPEAKLEALTLIGPLPDVDDVTDVIVGIQKSIPQIEISVRVVEVSETDAFSFGFDTFFQSVETDPNSPTRTFFNRASTILGLPEIPGRGATFNPGSSITPLLIDLGTVTNGVQVDFLIRALKLFSKTDVLSAPALRVLDGYSAEIIAGEDIPFFEPKFSASGFSTISTSFKQIGIKLFINPTVVGRDMVRISLTTGVEAVTRESTFVSNDVTVTNPVITTRRISTFMDVYDGDTAILGGLLTRSKFDSENRVPVLGEIPVLNVLFSSRSKQVLQSNLIFFITPRIIDPSRDRRRMITPVIPSNDDGK
ncbi:MAG: hypothetical protein KDB53_18645, partial [Planctomycetes bacterium]|nr:hypothetical protein [Planctomycetota bacterium]